MWKTEGGLLELVLSFHLSCVLWLKFRLLELQGFYRLSHPTGPKGPPSFYVVVLTDFSLGCANGLFFWPQLGNSAVVSNLNHLY